MRILYIYRHPHLGYSIGKVFRSIEEEMKKYAEVDAIYLPEPNYSLKGLWKNIRYAQKYCKRKKYDIIHITGTEHYLIPFLKQCVVVTIHDLGHYLSLKGIRKIAYNLLHILPLRKANKIVCISNYTKDELFQAAKCDISNVTIVPDAVGHEFIIYDKLFNTYIPTILHIGTRPHKNLERTIEALKGIKCKIVIVGKISDEIRTKLQNNNIQYVNKMNLSDEEIIQEYINADIVNFPSYHEGFGMPIIEAQAIGRVVITSDMEPMKSVASNGAILCNPFDINSIRKAYLDVIQNSDLRYNIIKEGFENVKKYSVQTICKQYFNLYNALLK